MPETINLVIADDHAIFRRGLLSVIGSEPGFEVVAETGDGETALSAIIEHEPDVAVLDIDMPGKDGFEVAKAVQEKNLATAIVFLTMHNTETLFNAALDAGAKGFVLKDGALPEIVDCIRAVASGKKYISPQLSSYLVDRSTLKTDSPPSVSKLTVSETRILKLIAEQKTSREIADLLFISIRTVDRHRSNICEKLDLRGPNALIRFAVANASKLS